MNTSGFEPCAHTWAAISASENEIMGIRGNKPSGLIVFDWKVEGEVRVFGAVKKDLAGSFSDEIMREFYSMAKSKILLVEDNMNIFIAAAKDVLQDELKLGHCDFLMNAKDHVFVFFFSPRFTEDELIKLMVKGAPQA